MTGIAPGFRNPCPSIDDPLVREISGLSEGVRHFNEGKGFAVLNLGQRDSMATEGSETRRCR